jgi:hypothetical protein
MHGTSDCGDAHQNDHEAAMDSTSTPATQLDLTAVRAVRADDPYTRNAHLDQLLGGETAD